MNRYPSAVSRHRSAEQISVLSKKTVSLHHSSSSEKVGMLWKIKTEHNHLLISSTLSSKPASLLIWVCIHAALHGQLTHLEKQHECRKLYAGFMLPSS